MMIHIEGEENVFEDEDEDPDGNGGDAKKDEELKTFMQEMKKVGAQSK